MAEALGAGFFVHLGDAVAVVELGAVAKAHTVIARKVRRGLGGRDDVIGGQGVFRMRQRDVDDLGARVFHHGDAVGPQLFNLLGHAIHAVLARDADLLAADVPGQRCLEVRHGQIGAGAVLGVMAAHGFQHDGSVAHCLGHRPSLVERGGEGHDAPAGAAAIGRLDPHGAGEGGGLAD